MLKPEKKRLILLAAAFLVFCSNQQPARALPQGDKQIITLEVDASEAPRHIFHARMSVPATPGRLTLVYPKWIPGEHGPTGPIANLVGLKITAAGKEIEWRRDELDMYAFHCDVPPDVRSVDVSLDFLSPMKNERIANGYSSNATPMLSVFNWNTALLYPQGTNADELMVAAIIRLPDGWKFGTALEVAKNISPMIEFQPVTLTTLVDSPIITGKYFRSFDLAPGNPIPHRLDVVADSPGALNIPPTVIENLSELVSEAYALFGARHYRRYCFLVTLSDAVRGYGLEHRESSDNRLSERTFLDETLTAQTIDLLAHELVHSWNGKYRRPQGLVTRDFQQPVKTDLLWVYEGLTDYLNYVLCARTGLLSPEQAREFFASFAASMDARTGRKWRSLADTSIATQILEPAPSEWTSRRRWLDFYAEGCLIWLEVDTTIRRETGGRKSLDSFCQLFFGDDTSAPAMKPYTLDNLIDALASIAPYDWRTFFLQRVYRTTARAPLGGIEASGWKLDYTEIPNATSGANFGYSLGLCLQEDGTVSDVIGDLPAESAGISPGMKLIAVNGRRYSESLLHDVVGGARDSSEPISLLIENGEFFKTYRIDYQGGDRYPHLIRNTAKTDLLEKIFNRASKTTQK